ncbi:MAG: hypothetical protein ACYCSW_09525 [bacterium]
MGIQRNCKFMAGWDMKIYTRPPKKENQKIRLGGAHGSVAKGGFKGLKTWNISAQVSRVKGVENRGRSGAFSEYMERKEECVVAYGDESKIAKQKYAELEEKLFKQKKNSVIQRRFVIPLPKEILNNPEKVGKLLNSLQDRYFSSCYTFSAALHKSENCKNPHVHIAYSNVDANFKAIREFQDPNMLNEIKKDIKFFIENELKIKCQMKGIGKSIKHYPKWISGAVKRAEEAEKRGDGGKMMREYEERYPLFSEYISERNRKLYERAIQLKENKIKKTAEVEKMCVVNLNENIKNKINGTWSWLYSKKEKEELKKDIKINDEVIDEIKNSVGGYDFAEELRQKEERERLEKEKQEKLKKEQNNKNEKKELVKVVKENDYTVIVTPGYFNPHNWNKADIEETPEKKIINEIAADRTTEFRASFNSAKYDFKGAGGLVIKKAENPDWKEKLDKFIVEDKMKYGEEKAKELESLNDLKGISKEKDGFTKSFTESLNKGKGFGR